MLPKTLNSKLQQLGLIPTLVFIILISCGLLGLYSDRLTQLEQEQSHIAINWISDQALKSLTGNTSSHKDGEHRELALAAQSLIESLQIESVHIYDAEKKLIASAGPKIRYSADMFADTEVTGTTPNDKLFSTSPIYSQEQTLRGWAVIAYDRHLSSTTEHLGIIVTMASIILAFAILAGLANRLNREIQAPLQHIFHTLEAFNNDRFNVRAPVDGSQELQQLAKEVNQLGATLQKSKLEVQQQIQQATQELEESLEALEVQNVQLDLARKDALQASKVKSEFLANTSHEIRTPINGIIGFTSLLLKTQLTNQQREYLRTIANSSQGLLTIINDILDFSRIESGKLTLDHAPLDLRELIEETLQILAPAANEKQQQLICLLDHTMPLELIGDSLRLKQVLSNLVSNASKFSARGSIIIRANCVERQGNRAQIKISVSDSGLGIPLNQQKLIFEAFSQVDTAHAREQGGTGLGLAIAKGLVERMNGAIGVESEPGQGATFWFTAELRVTDAPPQFEAYQGLKGKHIGLLDLNAISRLHLEHLLEGWQVDLHAIDHDTGIPEVLKSAQARGQHLNALIISTDFDGDEFRAEYLRHLVDMAKTHWQIPVLVVCQPETIYSHHTGLMNSASEVIAKPVTHDRLYQALCEHTGAPAVLKALPAQASVSQPRKKARILAVDDNPANLQLVTEFLQGLGTEVTQANSGREALEKCRAHSFDLIFMDIQMPGLDGLETTRQLRASEPAGKRTPVIALTAHAMNEQKSQLLLAGMDDYTTKPVSEAQLAHVLNRWLESGNPHFQPARIDMDSVASPPLSTELAPEPTSLFDIMDLSTALRLSNYKPRLARDMLQMLLDSLPDTRQNILDQLEQQQWDQLEHCVHKLYGGCCYCGVPQLLSASELVDKLLQKAFYSELHEPIESLIKAIDTLLEWADEHDIDSLFEEESVE